MTASYHMFIGSDYLYLYLFFILLAYETGSEPVGQDGIAGIL